MMPVAEQVEVAGIATPPASVRRRLVLTPAHTTGVALNELPWHYGSMDATLVLGQQGRLVIPAEVRAALGLVPGDRLHLHLAGPRLVLERQQDAVAELRQLGKGLPQSRSLVDELLAERQLAAASE
jgi:antitoxin PrlF